MTDPATDSSPNTSEITKEGRTTLIRVLRVAFPHPSFPAGPYERMADKLIADAAASTWLRVVLSEGLLSLDLMSGGRFVDLGDDAAYQVLKHIEGTELFGFIRRTTVVSLYDDHEVWTALGYEGPSFDQGGYVDRGFDDIDWLPQARITEYEGEALVEIAPSMALRRAAPAPDTRSRSGTSESRMSEVHT